MACSPLVAVMSDSASPWTAACQAPLSMGFPHKNTEYVAISFSRGSFPTQGSNLCLLHWQTDSSPLSHQGSPWLASEVGLHLSGHN